MYRPILCCCAAALLLSPALTARGGTDPFEVQIRRLRDPDPAVRVKASETLLEMAAESWRRRLRGNPGPRPGHAVPALVEALKDENVRVRRNAVEAIGLIGDRPKLAVPALIRAMEDKGVVGNENATSVSHSAVIALRHFGVEAREAVSALLKYARSNDHSLKGLSIGTLGSIGAEREKVVPLLLDILKDNREMKLWGVAAVALAEFNPSPGAVVVLKEAFEKVGVQDPTAHRVIQDHILCAMKDLGNRETDPRTRRDVVAPFLLKVAKDRNRNEALRSNAVRYIGELRPPAEHVAKELVACVLSEEYLGLAGHIDKALVKLGPDAVGPLLGALDHPKTSLRAWGAGLLGRIGPMAGPALPKLRQLTKERDPIVTNRSVFAIQQIEKK
jgi:HEAT repeat protein